MVPALSDAVSVWWYARKATRSSAKYRNQKRDEAEQEAELGEGLAGRSARRKQHREVAGRGEGGRRDVRIGGGQGRHATIYETGGGEVPPPGAPPCGIVLCIIKYLQPASELV